MTSPLVRIQLSVSEKDFVLKLLKPDMVTLREKIQQATQLAKLRSYRECFLTEEEFQALAGVVRFEAKHNKKKAFATIAQEILETLHGVWESHKRA